MSHGHKFQPHLELFKQYAISVGTVFMLKGFFIAKCPLSKILRYSQREKTFKKAINCYISDTPV